jgi:RHS repeat-associated protein
MQGQQMDAETGLFYNRFRYYQPITGRYMTQDPIGLRDGLNIYAYTTNMPNSFVDPTGLGACYVKFPDYPIDTGLGFKADWIGGHAGVLSYDAKGGTQYYEYGRYSQTNPNNIGVKLPAAEGNVKKLKVSNVKLDKNGNLTPESEEKIKKELSICCGHNTKVELKCDSEVDSKKVNEYANSIAKNAEREHYKLLSNSCRNFASKAISAGK